jgi:hypothetical protein
MDAKGYVGKRPRTWLSLAPAGRNALSGHVRALEQIVQHAERAAAAEPAPVRGETGRTA